MKGTRFSARAEMGTLIAVFALMFGAGAVRAQDPVKVAPRNFKVLLENESVRVLDFHSSSGVKVPMHSHPNYLTYGISGSGKTKFTSLDGKVTEAPDRTGVATWNAAETHASEYIGTGEIHVLLVEFKAATPK